MPRALDAREIPAIVAEYAAAARNAVAAGMDGVELHCASGYLVNQFLNPVSNRRTDAYGGAPENRIRFALEVLAAMADAIGPGRVGFRIAPGNGYNGMDPADPAETFAPLLAGAAGLGLAYVHVIDSEVPGFDPLALARSTFGGPVIANNNLDAARGAALLAAGRAEAVSVGRAFIANPDLVARIAAGAPLAKPDYAHVYTGEARGYTDYPALGG
jgi:N-ethylmaleimide reductase